MFSRVLSRSSGALARSAQVSSRRCASSGSTVHPKSDAPWIVASAAVTIPALYFVTKPPAHHDEDHHAEKPVPPSGRNPGVSIQLPEENEASNPSPPEKGQEALKSSRDSAPENQPKLEANHSADHDHDLKQKTSAAPATYRPDETKLGDAARLSTQGQSHNPKGALAEHFTARDATDAGGQKPHPGDKEATVVKEREGKKEGTSDEKTESSAEDKEE